MNEMKEIDDLFFHLVISLQMAAMQRMGKIISPISGELERDLDQAKTSIDMLAMLLEKTKANLTQEEDKFLSSVLYELRMNYLDEAKKPQPEKGEDKENKKTENLGEDS